MVHCTIKNIYVDDDSCPGFTGKEYCYHAGKMGCIAHAISEQKYRERKEQRLKDEYYRSHPEEKPKTTGEMYKALIDAINHLNDENERRHNELIYLVSYMIIGKFNPNQMSRCPLYLDQTQTCRFPLGHTNCHHMKMTSCPHYYLLKAMEDNNNEQTN